MKYNNEDNNNNSNLIWKAKSAALTAGLIHYAMDQGLSQSDGEHYAAFVAGQVRIEMQLKAVKSLIKNEKAVLAKEYKPTQKVSKDRFDNGQKEQWLTHFCRDEVRAIIHQDEALAALEKSGFGMDWTATGAVVAWLAYLLGQWKASREQSAKAKAARAAKAAEVAKEEEMMLG